MKKKLVLGLSFLMLIVISAYIVYQTSNAGVGSTARIYTGYLVCQSCAGASQGIAADGINVLKHPEKHTVGCLRMPSCIASGYGMFIKKSNGCYTYYKFDKKGSDLAYQCIVRPTKKVDNLLVEVTGKMKNEVIIINDIAEK